METRPTTHPSVDVLRALSAGKLDDAAIEPVLAHLETCHDCQTQLSGISGDNLLARFRPGSPRAATAAPPKLDVLPELRNHPQFEVLRELGRGGMGVVYLAKNKLMEREEVLKVVNKQLLGHDGAAERFLREIRAAAKLNHPNIVTAYTTLQVGDLLVLAMEYIEGDDLAKVVKDRGPLPVANACFYVHQAALGLQHASERGMIHRDIKPGNLILAREGKKHIVKILDFGLAKATRDEGTAHDLTGDNKMLGTPDYIAPEQALDAARADIRADIYSLGCSLHYLLMGRAPFKAHSLYELLHAHMSVNATPVHELRPDVPAALSAIIAKMMAKDPAQRYQTPAEVAKALTPFVKGSVKALPGERTATGFDPRTTTAASPDGRASNRAETVIQGGRQETMAAQPTPLVQLSSHVAAHRPSGQPGGRKLMLGVGIGIALLLMLVLATAVVIAAIVVLRPAAAPIAQVKKTDNVGPTKLPAAAPKPPSLEPSPKPPDSEPAPKVPDPMPAPKLPDPVPAPKPPDPVPAPKPPDPAPAPKPPDPVAPRLAFLVLRDADSAAYQNWLDQLKPKGYRPVFVNGYTVAARPRFVAIAYKDETGEPWIARNDLTPQEYQLQFDKLPKGYRPISISGYLKGSVLRFAGIWARGPDIGWWGHHTLTAARHAELTKEHEKEDMQAAYITGYFDGQVPQFSSIFTHEPLPRTAFLDLTNDSYQKVFDEQKAAGYRPISISGYQSAKGPRFAAVFIRDDGKLDWESRRHLTPAQYQEQFDRLSDQGYHPLLICGYAWQGATRYATIWAKERP